MRDFNPLRQIAKSVLNCLIAFVLMAVALKVYGVVGIGVIALVAPIFGLTRLAATRIDRKVAATKKPTRYCYAGGRWHARG
ncbi:hypothetical protein AB1L88_15535 [Tautonia sp. JC769]|uniref:hypothetical protein n=1 Tax=Tautonia sp. JC769 TaxID=3232135 RepID=UPI00345B32BA